MQRALPYFDRLLKPLAGSLPQHHNWARSLPFFYGLVGSYESPGLLLDLAGKSATDGRLMAVPTLGLVPRQNIDLNSGNARVLNPSLGYFPFKEQCYMVFYGDELLSLVETLTSYLTTNNLMLHRLDYTGIPRDTRSDENVGLSYYASITSRHTLHDLRR